MDPIRVPPPCESDPLRSRFLPGRLGVFAWGSYKVGFREGSVVTHNPIRKWANHSFFRDGKHHQSIHVENWLLISWSSNVEKDHFANLTVYSGDAEWQVRLYSTRGCHHDVLPEGGRVNFQYMKIKRTPNARKLVGNLVSTLQSS